MQLLRMYKVLLLLVLLCTERGNADFGTYVPDVVHLPAQLDADFHAELLRNGLHAEIVGEVADQKKECGILLMDYTAYVDGELFEVAVKAIENDLLTSISSAFLNETLQYTLYKAMKATALAAHKAEMRQLFDIRRASTPIYRSVDLRLFPFAGLVVLGIGMGIGGLMVKGITSLMQNQEVKALEKEMTDEWLFLIQTFNMISNTLTFEASSLRFGYALTLVRQQLLSRVRDTLDQLFAFGRIAEELMETSSNHSFMLATQQLMGERFKNSLLALHGSSARNALKATVTGMNKKVMEIQLCYPTTMPSDVNYLLRVEPLGQFSHNMSFFWMHDIGGLYAVAKNQTNVTLADLKTVQDENACYLSSSVQLCKLREQAPGCTLLMADRHSCRFVVRNSSNTHFTFVRPIARSVIIATKEKRMHVMSHQTSTSPPTISVPSTVFAVEVPRGKWLVVGEEIIHSRVVQGTLDANLNVIIPDATPQYPPDASPPHMGPDSWMHRFDGMTIMMPWFCLLLAFVCIVVVMCALAYRRSCKRMDNAEKMLSDLLHWRNYVDTYRLPLHITHVPEFHE